MSHVGRETTPEDSHAQSPSPQEPPQPPRPLPEQPYSIFDHRQKAVIVTLVTIAGNFTGFASNIYFPALPAIADDLHVSIELVNLSVTSYLVFQGIAPSLWGPVSDVRGRRIAYICTFVVFLGACIGLALLQNYATLVVLRCLQSAGSASTIAIGSGVIADITTRAERGGYMGIFQGGSLVSVAVGPIIGGALAGSLGWRSIFWFLTIYSGAFLVFLAFLLPETLRSMVANGSIVPSNPVARFPLTAFQRSSKINSAVEASAPSLAARKQINLVGPFRILFSKQAAPIIVFLAVCYAVWQMSITAMSSLFKSRYGLGETQIGLTFIANGVGSMVGTFITGRLLDFDYRRVKEGFKRRRNTRILSSTPSQHQQQLGDGGDDQIGAGDDHALTRQITPDDFPLEHARLRLVPVLTLVQSLAILLFGWTIQYPRRVSIAVPIVASFFVGWTAVSTQSVVMTYLVDSFSEQSAAASASLNLARCIFAAGGTSFIMPMIDGVGVGLAFTICAAAQVVGMSGVFVQWRLAGRWRRQAEERRTKAGEER